MTPPRRWPAVVAVVVGVGLALAPLAFQMFDRAPDGGAMIDDFAPYMTIEEINDFRAHLTTIGAARDEVAQLRQRIGDDEGDSSSPVGVFVDQFPAIDDDMRSMLDTMEANLGNYEGVAALPPFPLFPWFFVLPGVMIAVAGGLAIRSPTAAGPRRAVLALGVGLLAAPLVFQMFTRAPGGAEMISDFERLMTSERVTEVQGYFLVIGGGEAELRRTTLPEWREANLVAAGDLPATESFGANWPTISQEMAPMIGTMADNLDNFEAVVALPDFALFPWFFAVPGVLLVGLALALRPARAPTVGEHLPIGQRARQQVSFSTLRRARNAGAVATVLSLLTLAVLALLAETGEIELSKGPVASQTAPIAASPSSRPTRTDAEPGASETTLSPAPVSTDSSPSSPPTTTTETVVKRPSDDDGAGPPPEPSPPDLEPCALGIPPPERSGGLASFTPVIPAFGPFAAEAFAFSPAYEPVVELFGPWLPILVEQLEQQEATTTPLITQLRQLEQVGFDTVEPVYGPHRQEFLDAARELAETMAPHAEQLRDSPAGTCFVALQGLVADNAG